jgi:hypothetical protein
MNRNYRNIARATDAQKEQGRNRWNGATPRTHDSGNSTAATPYRIESCRQAAEFYRAHLAQGFAPSMSLGLTIAAEILEIARELSGGGRHG